jgi:RNA polymerase sigma-70 factor, ECF subfamily
MPHDAERPDVAADFAFVLEEYGRFLRSAIARICPRDMGLQFDDVEQEARLKLWRALESKRPIEDLASYIYKVAACATIDAIRRVKARREEPLEPGPAAGEAPRQEEVRRSEEAERTLDRRRLLEKVEGVLARLDDRRRTVVRLYLQGFTTTEMAALLGSTEPAARNLLHRARQELRERLEEEGLTYAGD